MIDQIWSPEILCVSSLPVSLMEIEYRVTEKRWIYDFLLHKPTGKTFSAQGRITPKKQSDPAQIQTHTELLCISLLPANTNQKWVPLRAMKTFIRKKIAHTT